MALGVRTLLRSMKASLLVVGALLLLGSFIATDAIGMSGHTVHGWLNPQTAVVGSMSGLHRDGHETTTARMSRDHVGPASITGAISRGEGSCTRHGGGPASSQCCAAACSSTHATIPMIGNLISLDVVKGRHVPALDTINAGTEPLPIPEPPRYFA